MTIIDRTKIESAAYDNIYAIIDNRSNVVDPKRKGTTHSTTQKRKFVYDTDPFMRSINYSDMPYIVLELPILEYSAISTDGKHKDILWTQRIIVRTKKEGSSTVLTDTGRTDMFEICDDLHETFNKDSIKTTQGGYNIHKVNLTKINTSFDVIDNIELYESEFELTYYTRLQVST